MEKNVTYITHKTLAIRTMAMVHVTGRQITSTVTVQVTRRQITSTVMVLVAGKHITSMVTVQATIKTE